MAKDDEPKLVWPFANDSELNRQCFLVISRTTVRCSQFTLLIWLVQTFRLSLDGLSDCFSSIALIGGLSWVLMVVMNLGSLSSSDDSNATPQT